MRSVFGGEMSRISSKSLEGVLSFTILLGIVISFHNAQAQPNELKSEFRELNPYIGSGTYSNVSLVEHIESKSRYALKVKTRKRAVNGDAYMKHANLHLLWRHVGLATTDIIYVHRGDPKSHVILHGFVDGLTLNQAQEKTHFFSDPESTMYKALEDFLEKLLLSHVFILDLNAKNIVFNLKTEKWEIIDSQRGRVVESLQECYELYKKIFSTRKWVARTNRVPLELVLNFFKLFEAKKLKALIEKNSTPRKATIELVNEINMIADQWKLHSRVKVWYPKKQSFSEFMQNTSQKASSEPEKTLEEWEHSFESLPESISSLGLLEMIAHLPVITDHGPKYFSPNGVLLSKLLFKHRFTKLAFEEWIGAILSAVQSQKITSKDTRRILLILLAQAEKHFFYTDFVAEKILSVPIFKDILLQRSEMFMTSRRYDKSGAKMYGKIMSWKAVEKCPASFQPDGQL
jgi:hypothetical protein